MKAGTGKHFEQCYNAQAAVDAEGSMMILGCRVSSSPNDKQELAPTVDSIDETVRTPSHVLADTRRPIQLSEAVQAVRQRPPAPKSRLSKEIG